MRIFSHWELADRPEAAKSYPHPVLILAGRQDATAGYTGPSELFGITHARRLPYLIAPATRCSTSNPTSREPWSSNGSCACASVVVQPFLGLALLAAFRGMADTTGAQISEHRLDLGPGKRREQGTELLFVCLRGLRNLRAPPFVRGGLATAKY